MQTKFFPTFKFMLKITQGMVAKSLELNHKLLLWPMIVSIYLEKLTIEVG